jgi:CxxC motif-containing protein (DUF1111 family)
MSRKANSGTASRRKSTGGTGLLIKILSVALVASSGTVVLLAQAKAVDPGVRKGLNAGTFFPNMTLNQKSEQSGFRNVFFEVNNQVTTPVGLGPAFSSDSCSSCHAQPAQGGSSPASNPLFAIYQLNGATNTMPFFVTPTSPVVNARSPFMPDMITPDGRVQQLFVITGRTDAGGCNAVQPNFAAEAAANNLIFRQTTPTFGLGLVEIIQNADIIANMNANLPLKQSLGISGHPSIAEDGSVSRFGWKAQGRSLIQFSGDAYNIEEGITNELAMNEINQTPGCDNNPLPEDHTNFSKKFAPHDFDADPDDLSNFMRFLQPPTPQPLTQQTRNGQAQFNAIGCVLCHTTSFTTPVSSVAVLSNIQTNLLSDLLVHHMGPCLADNIVQGNVLGDEFRTAPLWGAGQRVFFLHDGKTTDIVQAIEGHFCAANGQYGASEANAVITAFNKLTKTNQQAIVNFLRSL